MQPAVDLSRTQEKVNKCESRLGERARVLYMGAGNSARCIAFQNPDLQSMQQFGDGWY